MSNENRTMTAAERAALANAREAEAQRKKYASSKGNAAAAPRSVNTAQRPAARTNPAHNTNEYPNIKRPAAPVRKPATKPKTAPKAADKEDTGEFPSYVRAGKGGGYRPKKPERRQVARQHRRKMDIDPRVRAALLAVGAVLAIIILLLIIGVRYSTIKLSNDGEIKFFGIVKDGEPASGWISNSNGVKGKLKKNKIEYSDGSIYEGTIVNAMRSGQGKYTAADGAVYEGTFSEDKMNGQFTVHYADGSTYVGGFVNDMLSGNGTRTFKRENGFDTYEGAFENNMLHGKGKMTYADGNVYEGEFKNNDKSGKGIVTYANGDIYDGYFANDIRTEGTYKFKNGAIFVGKFAQNKDNEMLEGTYTYTTGSSVTGKYDKESGTFIAE